MGKAKYWEAHSTYGLIMQIVCIDKNGNLLWRQEYDSTKTNIMDISLNGKYITGGSWWDPPISSVALWDVDNGAKLWEKSFPDINNKEKRIWGELVLHPETGHKLFQVCLSDTIVYFDIAGNEVPLKTGGVHILLQNPAFGYKRNNGIFTFYKVRW